DGHAPRKPRRRRGGRRTGGADGAQGAQSSQGTQQVAARQPGRPADGDKRGSARHSPPPAAHGEGGGSLLSRIGRGLRSLVTRAPRSQH
ncbi:MAG: hypothetical protein ACTHOC_08830, partial [Luteimonas sp.]